MPKPRLAIAGLGLVFFVLCGCFGCFSWTWLFIIHPTTRRRLRRQRAKARLDWFLYKKGFVQLSKYRLTAILNQLRGHHSKDVKFLEQVGRAIPTMSDYKVFLEVQGLQKSCEGDCGILCSLWKTIGVEFGIHPLSLRVAMETMLPRVMHSAVHVRQDRNGQNSRQGVRVEGVKETVGIRKESRRESRKTFASLEVEGKLQRILRLPHNYKQRLLEHLLLSLRLWRPLLHLRSRPRRTSKWRISWVHWRK